jgi:hypothetical protein
MHANRSNQGALMMKFPKTVLWIVGGVLAVACSKSPEQREAEMARSESTPEGMTPTSGMRSAADQIADARCEREQRCGNIGADETYSSSQDCLARIRNDWRNDLNARECPGGINQQELDECLAQVRAEECGNPFDTLARVSDCMTAQICIEEAGERR